MIVSYEVGPTSDHFRPPRSGYYAPSNWLSIENSVFFWAFSGLDCFRRMLMFACCLPSCVWRVLTIRSETRSWRQLG